MVRHEDFIALLKVFHGHIKEMAEKPTYLARKAVIEDWLELMGKVDRSIGGILEEKSLEKRQSMVRDFEKIIEELGYDIRGK